MKVSSSEIKKIVERSVSAGGISDPSVEEVCSLYINMEQDVFRKIYKTFDANKQAFFPARTSVEELIALSESEVAPKNWKKVATICNRYVASMSSRRSRQGLSINEYSRLCAYFVDHFDSENQFVACLQKQTVIEGTDNIDGPFIEYNAILKCDVANEIKEVTRKIAAVSAPEFATVYVSDSAAEEVVTIETSVSYDIPAMATHIVSLPQQKEYIDMFCIKRSMFLVGHDSVETVSPLQVADIEHLVVPGIDNSKKFKQLADAYVAKRGIKFVQPKSFVCASYDLETFWYKAEDEEASTNGVPEPTEANKCGISVAGLYVKHQDGRIAKTAFCFVPYAARKVNLAPIKRSIEEAGIVVKFYYSQLALVTAFMLAVRELTRSYEQVFMMSFNGSSTMHDGDFGSSSGLGNGYDLPFLLQRCGMLESLVGVYTSAYKGLVRGKNENGLGPAQTAMINYFGPRVHFIDFRSFLFSKQALYTKIGAFANSLKSQTLNGYLRAFGLPLKDEVDASRIGECLRSLQTSEKSPFPYDIIVKYCLEDCRAVSDINDKTTYVADSINMQSVVHLPLSAIFHRTEAQMGVSYLLREINSTSAEHTFWSILDLRNYIASAAKGGDNAEVIAEQLRLHGCNYTRAEVEKPKVRYDGGFNVLRKKPAFVRSVLTFRDFASLYPSAILCFSVSPWTYVGIYEERPAYDPEFIDICNDPDNNHLQDWPQDDIADGNVNYEFVIGCKTISAKKTYVRFRKTPESGSAGDIYFSTIRRLFEQRTEFKAAQAAAEKSGNTAEKKRNNVLEQGVKLIMNALYGLSGSETSPIYHPVVCAMVPLIARICTYSAFRVTRRRGAVLYGDTDSLALTHNNYPNPAENLSAFKSYVHTEAAEITRDLRSLILADVPNADVERIRMPFEEDKIMTRFLAPLKKKTYMYKQMNPKSGAMKFKSNGIKFSQLSVYCEESTKSVCERILDIGDAATADEEVAKQTTAVLTEFITAEHDRISPATIDDYSLLFKDRNKIIIYIKSKKEFSEYCQIDKKLRVVPCIGLSRKVCESYIPAGEYAANPTKYTIDKAKLLRLNYCANLTRFWPELSDIVDKAVGSKTPVYRFNNEIVNADLGESLVRREVSRGNRICRQTPKPMTIAKIKERLANCKDYECYNEVNADIIRATFDLDGYECALLSQEEFNRRINIVITIVGELVGAVYDNKVLFANGQSGDKYKLSSHIHVAFAAAREHMKLIAAHVADEVNIYDGDKAVLTVDLAIYDNHHSLRLPLCNKIGEDGTISKRPFILRGGNRESTLAALDQCLMCNLDGPDGKPLPELPQLFDLPNALSIIGPFTEQVRLHTGNVAETMAPELLEECAKLLAAANTDVPLTEITKSLNYDVYKPTSDQASYYRVRSNICDRLCCYFSGWKHKGDHLKVYKRDNKWVINCFCAITGRCKEAKPEYVISSGEKSQKKKTAALVEHIIKEILPNCSELRKVTPAEGYVNYDLSADVTFVKASLGKGKTYVLSQLMDSFKSILMMSPRRAFAENMAARMSKCNVQNYSDLHGKIEFSRTTRLILQIDSLHRLVMTQGCSCDLLVLDELMALFDQLRHACEKKPNLADKFVRLIKIAKKIVILDGTLNERTIEIIKRIRSGNDHSCHSYKYFEHLTQPYRGKSFGIRVSNFHSKAHEPRMIAEEMLEQVANGPIVSFCSSLKLCTYIVSRFEMKGLRVLVYNGDDLQKYEGKTMYQIKREDLSRINDRIAEFQPHLLIYTSTITVGIDIVGKYFASEYHICESQVGANNMIQAFRRVREFSSAVAKIVISPISSGNCNVNDMSEVLSKNTTNPANATMGLQLIAALAVGAADVAKYWWAQVLDMLYFEGADFYSLPEFKEPKEKEENPLKFDLAGALSKLVITETQWTRAELIFTNERKGKATDPDNEMPDDMSLVMKKYSLARRYQFTLAEVNELTNVSLIKAAIYDAKKHLSDGLGYEIKKEQTFAAKLNRLSAIAATMNDEIEVKSCGKYNESEVAAVTSENLINARETSSAVDDCLREGMITSRTNSLQYSIKAMLLREIISYIKAKLTEKMFNCDGKTYVLARNFEYIAKLTIDKFSQRLGSNRMTYSDLIDILAANKYPIVAANVGNVLCYQLTEESDAAAIAGADEVSATDTSIRASVLRAYSTATERLSIAELYADVDVSDIKWIDVKIAEIYKIDKTLAKIGKSLVKLIAGAYILHSESSDVIANAIRAKINKLQNFQSLATNGIYVELRKKFVNEEDRKRVFSMAKDTASTVRKQAAEKAKKLDGISLEDFPAANVVIENAARIAATKVADLVPLDFYYILACTCARFDELTTAEITERDSKWYYSGIKKGKSNESTELEFVSLVEPAIAAVLLKKAKKYLIGKKSATVTQAVRRAMEKSLYDDGRKMFPNNNVKLARVVGANQAVNAAVERGDCRDTIGDRLELLMKAIHHMPNDAQTVNELPYSRVKMAK